LDGHSYPENQLISELTTQKPNRKSVKEQDFRTEIGAKVTKVHRLPVQQKTINATKIKWTSFKGETKVRL
jgi:exonuclease I